MPARYAAVLPNPFMPVKASKPRKTSKRSKRS